MSRDKDIPTSEIKRMFKSPAPRFSQGVLTDHSPQGKSENVAFMQHIGNIPHLMRFAGRYQAPVSLHTFSFCSFADKTPAA